VLSRNLLLPASGLECFVRDLLPVAQEPISTTTVIVVAGFCCVKEQSGTGNVPQSRDARLVVRFPN